MRTIKFRGKCVADSKYAGQWVYGGYSEPQEDCKQNEGLITVYLGGSSTCKYHVIPNTVGQFTGLHDKNGKEIYEGDIMGLPENDANGVKYKNRYTRVVEWVNDGFFLLDYCTMGGEVRKYGDRLALEISLKSNYDGIARCFQRRGLDYTVIGNIHDNPELLKTKS